MVASIEEEMPTVVSMEVVLETTPAPEMIRDKSINQVVLIFCADKQRMVNNLMISNDFLCNAFSSEIPFVKFHQRNIAQPFEECPKVIAI